MKLLLRIEFETEDMEMAAQYASILTELAHKQFNVIEATLGVVEDK